jgi:hypothetical protein
MARAPYRNCCPAANTRTDRSILFGLCRSAAMGIVRLVFWFVIQPVQMLFCKGQTRIMSYRSPRHALAEGVRSVLMGSSLIRIKMVAVIATSSPKPKMRFQLEGVTAFDERLQFNQCASPQPVQQFCRHAIPSRRRSSDSRPKPHLRWGFVMLALPPTEAF